MDWNDVKSDKEAFKKIAMKARIEKFRSSIRDKHVLSAFDMLIDAAPKGCIREFFVKNDVPDFISKQLVKSMRSVKIVKTAYVIKCPTTNITALINSFSQLMKIPDLECWSCGKIHSTNDYELTLTYVME